MYLIAMDGKYLPNPLNTTRVIIPPGGRADVLIQCQASGLYDIISTSQDVLLNTELIYDGPLFSLEIIDLPNDTLIITDIPAQLPPIWNPLFSLPLSIFPDSNVTFEFEGLTLDSIDNATNITRVNYAKPQEWTICTNDTMNLPYHQGVYSFQIISFPDSDQPFENTGFLPGMWRDTIPVSDRECVNIRFWAQAWDIFPGFCTTLFQHDTGCKFTFSTTNARGFYPYEYYSKCTSLDTIYPCQSLTTLPNATIDPDPHINDNSNSGGRSLVGVWALFIVLLRLIL